MTTYRQRLDTTTSWAITTIGVVTTFALGNSSASHMSLLLLMLLLVFFLFLEARRFRSCVASRIRILHMEQFFFPQLVDYRVDAGWVDTLVDMLQNPTPTLSQQAAVASRLRTSYLWMFGAVLLVWIVKLELSRAASNAVSLVDQASVGTIPGWLVVGIVSATYALLVTFALKTHETVPSVSQQTAILLQSDRH